MRKAGQPVDLEHLDRFTGGDRAVNEEILRLFDDQCRAMLETLERLAACETDVKSWREIIHTLKGAARGIGAFALGDAAEEAEKAETERAALMARLERLKRESAAVCGFIARFLNQGA